MQDRAHSVSRFRLSLAIITTAALLSLAACGSGTNSDTVGTTVTATFTGATMPSAIAFQAGATGTFQPLTLAGASASFSLPVGTTAYGFAYICPTFNAGNTYSNETIIQATTADTTSLSLACPSLNGNLAATYDVSAIPGAASTLLYEGYQSNQTFATSGVQVLPNVPTGMTDVALVALDASGAAVGIEILRGVNVTGSTSITFPPMTTADALGSAPASLTNVPSAATSFDFYTTYQTAGGLSAILPVHYTNTPQTTYPTVPASQTQPGDFYLLHAAADLPTQGLRAVVSSSSATAITAAFPSPWTTVPSPVPAAFPAFPANTSGFSVQGSIVNAAWTQFTSTAGAPTVYNRYSFVTQAWLATSSTFTVPDLSSLPGFTPAPPSGVREFWNLYSIAGSPLQFDSLQQSQPETFTAPASLQSIVTNGYFAVP